MNRLDDLNALPNAQYSGADSTSITQEVQFPDRQKKRFSCSTWFLLGIAMLINYSLIKSALGISLIRDVMILIVFLVFIINTTCKSGIGRGFLYLVVLIISVVFGVATGASLQGGDDSIPNFKTIPDSSHQKAVSHNNRGLEFYNQGRYNEAKSSLNEAIRLDPELASAHNNLGLVFDDLGSYEEAISSYLVAIRFDPELAMGHNNLGLAYYNQGRYNDAIVSINEAIRLDPGLTIAHYNLGSVFNNLGRYDDAIASFKETIRIDSENSNAHYNLGRAFEEIDRNKEAVDAYKEYIRLTPGDPDGDHDEVRGWIRDLE